ncbi:ABC transporter ced-7 [Aphelenchoides besseyi]|nr:ABC transporter ced-7 [Aphelenchoides besseyi]
MVKGRVICNGTPEFLKKRFGTGFLLTISLANGSVNTEQKAQRILGIAQQLISEAKFTGSPAAQFTINLPYESKIKFAQLFTELETRGQELDIDSFGRSVNTSEQVFIKVGEKAEGESNKELRARIVENTNAVRQGDHERSPFFIRQWFALCIRNFISSVPLAGGFGGDNDPDVRVERQPMAGIADQELALACRGLYKFYGAKCALQDLTFGIRSGECFGLLGINGAGKTTTFDIISNITKPSEETATINGVSVDRTPAIGYCPQFDALSGFLTAAETLRLFGRLNGFKDIETRKEMILECVMLKDHANKMVNKCNGGQKRRISIVVALMSGAECLLLDKPTAGVDPATRRQIWDLLTAVRLQGKAILCGNSYNLTFILNHELQKLLAQSTQPFNNAFKFRQPPTLITLLFLAWVIPRHPELKWSQMYTEVEKLIADIHRANPNAIRDFFLIQDSLEQVFTRLSTNKAQQNALKLTGLKNQSQQQVLTPRVISVVPNPNSQIPMTNQTQTNQTPTISQTPAVNQTPTSTTQIPTPDKQPATGPILQPSNENSGYPEAAKP